MVGSIPTSSQEAEKQPTYHYLSDYYKGNFDTDKIEVRIKNKSAAQEVKWGQRKSPG